MSRRPLRIGLVGMGNAAAFFHIPAIDSRPDLVELVRVSDPSAERLAEAGRLTRLPEDRLHFDAMELISSDDVDIVDIVVPPHLHKDLIIAAAEAGKHILCEKPLAVLPSEATEVIDAVEKAGVKIAIMHNWLLFPEIRELRRLAESGEIGDVRAVYITLMGMAPFPGTTAYRPAWRSDPKVAGGGVLMDMVHTVYLAEGLLGQQTRRVNAYVSSSEPESRVEDFAGLQVETDTNVGFINLALGHGSSEFEILGSTGAARASFTLNDQGRSATVRVTTADGERVEELPPVPGQWTAFSDTVAGIFEDLVLSVEQQRPPIADAREGLRMLEIVLAAYQSAATGQRVEVPLERDNPLLTDGVTALDQFKLDVFSAASRQGLFKTS